MDVDEGMLLKIFSKFGTVAECAFLWNFAGPNRGKPKGFCFVEMATHEQGEACISGLHGRRLKGRELRVNFAREEGEPPADVVASQQAASGAHPGASSSGAPAVNERLLERRALAVKMQLQRLGVVPKPATPAAAAAAGSAGPAVAAASTLFTTSGKFEEPLDPAAGDDVVADILGSD
jgi:hypothetical protein